MNNGNLANSAGLVSFNILSVNALYIDGTFFDGSIDNTLQGEIDDINTTLTNVVLPIVSRIDLSSLNGNLVITDANKNSVLKTAIDNINTQIAGFNKFDLTGLTGVGSCVITNATTNQALNGLISTNTSNIATNTSNIATNTSNIATNTSAIASINSQITAINNTISSINAKLAHISTWNWGSNTFTGIKDGTGFAVALGNGSQYDDNGIYCYGNDSDQTAQIRIQTQNAKQLYMSGGSATLIYAGSNDSITNRNVVRIGGEANHVQIGTLTTNTKFPLIHIGNSGAGILSSTTEMRGSWYFNSAPTSVYTEMMTTNGNAASPYYQQISTTNSPFFKGLDVIDPAGLITLSAVVGGVLLNSGAGVLALSSGIGAIALTTAGGAITATAAGGAISLSTGGGALTLSSGAGVMNFASATAAINTTTRAADIYLGAGKGTGAETASGNINLRAIGNISVSPDTETQIDKTAYIEMNAGSAPATTTRKLYHTSNELYYSGTKLSNQTAGYDVKALTQGDRITLQNNNGNYTITANNQVADYSVKALTQGDRITLTDNAGNITITANNQVADYNVKNITAGTNITLQNNNGNYTINSTGGGGGSGEGTIFILQNATSVVNTSPQNSMTSTYTSTALTTITRNAYTAGVNYAMGEFKSGYIAATSNLLLSGTYTADLYGLLTSNQLSYLYAKLYHVAERTTPATEFIVDKSLIYTTGSNANNYTILETKPISIPANEMSITLYRVVIPALRATALPVGTEVITLTLTMIDNTGATLYTFPTLQTTGNTTSDRIFQVAGGFTDIDVFSRTSYSFKLTRSDNSVQSSVIGQLLMRSPTDIVYKLGAKTKTLLYNGTSNKSTLTNGSFAVYQLNLPFPFNFFDISDYTAYSKIQFEPFFVQPSGSTTGHSFVLSFQDGALSHLHTSIALLATLADVLTAGNVANTSINMNSNNITNIGTISPTAITNWNVKSIAASAGSALQIVNTSGAVVITNPNDNEVGHVVGASSAISVKPTWFNQSTSWFYITNNLSAADNYVDCAVSSSGKYQIAVAADRTRCSTEYGVNWLNTNFSTFNLKSVCITGNGNRYYMNGDYRLFYKDVLYSDMGGGSSLDSFPILSSIYTYSRIACSQDGKYILVGTNNYAGAIYQSNNYGITSTTQATMAATINVNDVAMSADGKYQFLAMQDTGGVPGRIMWSSNYGVSFSAGVMSWGGLLQLTRVACSASGQYVVCVNKAGTGSIMVSSNYGKYFVASGMLAAIYEDICMSANGQFAIAISATSAMASDNYGTEFLQGSGAFPSATPNLKAVACSGNGSIVFAAGDTGRSWEIYDEASDVRKLSAGTNVVITNNGLGNYTIGIPAMPATIWTHTNCIDFLISKSGNLITLPTPVDLLLYDMEMQLSAMLYYEPDNPTNTLMGIYFNSFYSGKCIWTNQIHSGSEFGSAGTYAQNWLNPVFAYIPTNQNKFLQTISTNFQVSMLSNWGTPNNERPIRVRFQTSIGAGDNEALFNAYQDQQGHIQVFSKTTSFSPKTTIFNIGINQYSGGGGSSYRESPASVPARLLIHLKRKAA